MLGEVLRFTVLPMQRLHELAPAFDLLAFAEAAQRECLAFRQADGAVIVAIGDPFALDLQSWARERIGVDFEFGLAHRHDVAAYLARVEEGMRAMDGMVEAEPQLLEAGRGVEDLSLKTISEHASPVVKLVASTLYDALKSGASDVHIESTGSGLAIKHRIDGVLTQAGQAQGAEMAERIISRIKVMAELDIAERRVPQDGRFKVSLKGREVDFRVSIMPSIFGEDAVLRILDKQALADEFKGLRLEALGVDPASMAWLRKLANEPYGMLLVTGPTGSGKTTTLYAMLSEIHNGHDKIITIEDPVEYQLPGILQIPGQREEGTHLRARPALDPAPRSGQDHGGRDPRRRHRADRRAVGPHRPPGLHHRARQQRVRRDRPFPAHGRGSLQLHRRVERRHGTAPGAHQLRALQRRGHPDAALLAGSGLSAEAAREYSFRSGRGCASAAARVTAGARRSPRRCCSTTSCAN